MTCLWNFTMVLYKIYVKIYADSLNVIEGDASQNMWYKRYGHISEKCLSNLTNKKLITIPKYAVLDPRNYLVHKHHRVSFSTSSSKRLELLSLMHSAVCEPFDVESLSGNKFFLTFIDDASWKVWVCFLRTKDQRLEFFKQFHAMVEHETDKKLKYLCSDKEGECTSRTFDACCNKHDI